MTYDRTAIDRDLVNFKVALEGSGKDISETFMPVVAPASAYWLANEHYKTDEEFVYALADVLHEADTMLSRGQSWKDYRAWARLRVEALNHALRGLPEDRIRYHICFGSGKVLVPGVVTHHTNVVEHPELVAQRLVRLANVVGRERVMGGTDCGFAQGAFMHRVHEEIQWAKLASLVEGARIASRELWGAKAAV
jgi:5-methyltetrahydropteroyltriglutamate--homocysteine methyltransferase